AEDVIRGRNVTGVQTCALPISLLGEGAGDFHELVPRGGRLVVTGFFEHVGVVEQRQAADGGRQAVVLILVLGGVDERRERVGNRSEERRVGKERTQQTRQMRGI